MAIVIGDKSNTSNTNVSSLTFAHDVVAGEKLIVGTTAEDNSATDVVVTGITYGGVALTKIDGLSGDNAVVWNRSELWELTAPAAGTANVIISFTGSVAGCTGMAVCIKGLKAQIYEAKGTGSAGSSTAEIASAISITPGAFFIAVGNSGAGGDTFVLTAPPATELFNINNATIEWGGMGYRVAGAAGSYTIAWTLGNLNRWAEVIAAYAVVPESGMLLTGEI